MKQAAVAPVVWAEVAGVGLAGVALLLVSACGSALAHLNSGQATARAHPPVGVVPWVDRPAPVYIPPPPPPSPSPPPAMYVPCTAGGLTGRVGGVGMGTGQYTRYLVLTNVSGHACTLAGGPSQITGVRRDGRRVRLATGATPGISLGYGLLGPANLRPGHSAQVALTTTSMCARGAYSCGMTAYTAVTVGIGISDGVRVDFPIDQPFWARPRRGSFGASTFGVPLPSAPRRSSPLDVLTVTLAMPRRLTAGTTASYAVMLRNPTSHPVALYPCPSYAEFVWPLGTKWSRFSISRYYLNCRAVSAIPAGRSVTFAMRAPVPAISGRARLAKYGWFLQDTTVATGGAVTVATAGSRLARLQTSADPIAREL